MIYLINLDQKFNEICGTSRFIVDPFDCRKEKISGYHVEGDCK